MGRGGIVRDPALHSRAVENVSAAAVAAGLEVIGVKPSRVLGRRGKPGSFSLRALAAFTSRRIA